MKKILTNLAIMSYRASAGLAAHRGETMANSTPTRRSLSLLAVVFAATLPAAGCIDWIGMDQGSIFIDSVKLTDTCTGVSPQDPALGRGVLDVSLDISYTASLSMTTNLPATASTQQLQQERQRNVNYPDYGDTDTAPVYFTVARVWFSDADRFGEYVPNMPSDSGLLPWERIDTTNGFEIKPGTRERRTPVGGSVANTQTSLGAQSILFVPAISEQEVLALRNNFRPQSADPNQPAATPVFPNDTKTIVANITVEGKTAGGANAESTTFGFPITVCDGCLVDPQCPPGTAQVPVVDSCSPIGQDAPLFTCQ